MTKKEISLQRDTGLVISEAKIYQLGLLLTAFFLILIGYVRRSYNPDLSDSLALRYGLAFVMAAIAFASLRFKKIETQLSRIVQIFAFCLSIYLFYLSYSNNFQANYWISSLVVLGVGGIFFTGFREFSIYATGIILGFLILEFILYPDVSTPWLFPSFLPVSLLLQGFVIKYRAAVRNKIKMLASFPEDSPMPIIETNADGEIIYINASAKEEFPLLFSHSATHPLLNELKAFYQEATKEAKSKEINISLGDKSYQAQFFYVSHAGTFRCYITKIIRKADLVEEEANQRLAELKEVEAQLKERNQQMDSFLYKATHDLKGPLTSVVGILNIAIQDCLQPEIKQYIEMALASTDRLDNAILDLIHVTRLNKADLKPEAIDCRQVVGEILQSLDHVPGRNRIEFQTNISMRINFCSDRNSCISILQNLITNAIKYRRDGDHVHQVKININPHNAGIKIDVSDNGEGIKPEIQEKVFNMFYRGNKKSKGTGLGLYIVNQSIQKLKGNISIESVVGEGTTFSVWLPNMPQPEKLEA